MSKLIAFAAGQPLLINVDVTEDLIVKGHAVGQGCTMSLYIDDMLVDIQSVDDRSGWQPLYVMTMLRGRGAPKAKIEAKLEGHYVTAPGIPQLKVETLEDDER